MKKYQHIKILFEHNNAPEGGYGIESAWAIPINEDSYKIDNILFYAPEYSLGDIISVENRDGELFVTGLIKESGHSTVRIIFNNKKPEKFKSHIDKDRSFYNTEYWKEQLANHPLPSAIKEQLKFIKENKNDY